MSGQWGACGPLSVLLPSRHLHQANHRECVPTLHVKLAELVEMLVSGNITLLVHVQVGGFSSGGRGKIVNSLLPVLQLTGLPHNGLKHLMTSNLSQNSARFVGGSTLASAFRKLALLLHFVPHSHLSYCLPAVLAVPVTVELLLWCLQGGDFKLASNLKLHRLQIRLFQVQLKEQTISNISSDPETAKESMEQFCHSVIGLSVNIHTVVSEKPFQLKPYVKRLTDMLFNFVSVGRAAHNTDSQSDQILQ